MPSGGHDLKQGHKCCGCCCDVRRAVIAVNAISAVLAAISMSLLAAGVFYATNNPDELDAEEQQILDEANFGVYYGVTGASIALYLVGIFGAMKFNLIGVGLAALMHVANIVFPFIVIEFPASILNAIVPAFFLYPHLVLMIELHKGIMSEDNYKNEEHSCCCV